MLASPSQKSVRKPQTIKAPPPPGTGSSYRRDTNPPYDDLLLTTETRSSMSFRDKLLSALITHDPNQSKNK